MKFNVSVLSFGLVILALNLVLVTSDSSIGDDSSIVELSAPSIDKVRVSRRTTNCGVQTFKLLTLICANEFKFPVERQVIKGRFSEHCSQNRHKSKTKLIKFKTCFINLIIYFVQI